MTIKDRTCRGYAARGIAPHDLPDTDENFGAGGGGRQCRECFRLYRKDWRKEREAKGVLPRARRSKSTTFADLQMGVAGEGETVSDEEIAQSRSHEYVLDPDLGRLWHAVVSAAAGGSHPANLMFLGPSGSGKTDGAQYLAALVGLPFTKVDAASMTDPESWFGTREVIIEEGVSVTAYRPSTFVEAVQRPGVLLIDEINRVRDEHRNVLLPLLDGTHRVTNPLTGNVVEKDARCFVIMSGNRGLQFTGTYAVDPALMTRALVVDFDYAPEEAERRIVVQASGCNEKVAETLVRFAVVSRAQAGVNPDLAPISTRELILAGRLVSGGLTTDLAVRYAILSAASPEGGAASTRTALEVIWTGVRS